MGATEHSFITICEEAVSRRILPDGSHSIMRIKRSKVAQLVPLKAAMALVDVQFWCIVKTIRCVIRPDGVKLARSAKRQPKVASLTAFAHFFEIKIMFAFFLFSVQAALPFATNNEFGYMDAAAHNLDHPIKQAEAFYE